MKLANLTKAQSIKANLETFSFEVGSEYEGHSVNAVNFFSTYPNKHEVIDLGAGDGAATKHFLELGWKVTAVDINKDKLSRVPVAAKKVKADFLAFLGSAKDNQLPNIFCHHALEHFVDPNSVLKEVSRTLAPGGYCYIAVPANGFLESVHHSAFDSVDEIAPPGLEVVYKKVDLPNNHSTGQFVVVAKK